MGARACHCWLGALGEMWFVKRLVYCSEGQEFPSSIDTQAQPYMHPSKTSQFALNMPSIYM